MLCSFHQFGHCKFGTHCRKKHILETCNNLPCMEENCNKRHPKLCRYFMFSGQCKFKESCSFLHKSNSYIEKSVELEKEVKELGTEVRNIKQQVHFLESSLKQLLNSTSSKNSSLAANTSTLKPTNSIITTVQSNKANNIQESDGDQIPQLDGLVQDLCSPDPVFRCETCDKTFVSETDFKNHDSFQFCCDDCGICFSTQLAAHFHELEEHSDSHYANTYIPDSTKLLFTNNQARKT